MGKPIEDLEKEVHEIDKHLAVLVSTQKTTQEQVTSLACNVEKILEVSAAQASLGKKVEKLATDVSALILAEAKRSGAQGAGAWLVQNLPNLATLAAVLTFLGAK